MNKKYHFDGKKLNYELVLGLKQDTTAEDALSVLTGLLSMPDDLPSLVVDYAEYWGLRGMFMRNLKKVNANYFFIQFSIDKDFDKLKATISLLKQTIKRSDSILKGEVFKNEKLDTIGKQSMMLKQTLESIEKAKQEEDSERIIMINDYTKIVQDLINKFSK